MSPEEMDPVTAHLRDCSFWAAAEVITSLRTSLAAAEARAEKAEAEAEQTAQRIAAEFDEELEGAREEADDYRAERDAALSRATKAEGERDEKHVAMWRYKDEAVLEFSRAIEARSERDEARRERDAANAAIQYALYIDDIEWLAEWNLGIPDAMADLDEWRASAIRTSTREGEKDNG